MNPRSLDVQRIGNLPANLIDNILSRLSLRDAVRTSVLSKEWRYRWISIPDLVFDFHFDKTFLRKYQLENIVYQVLLQHQGSVNKFFLQVPSFITSHDADQWVRFLSNHQVQDLTLHFCRGFRFRMPSSFFVFHHLRHLNLYRCVLELPPGFKGFGQLVSLDCQKVDFAPAFFRQFVSQCPHLEKLRVVDCTDWDTIEIEGPKLRFFTFHGVFKSIRFKNCLVLAEVSLSIPICNYKAISLSSSFRKYFDFVPTLKKLLLHPRVLEFLGAGGAPHQLPSGLNRLRVLDLLLYLDTVEEVSFALCLIRSAPNLEMLKMTFYAARIVEAVMEYIRVQETSDCRMHQLKKVQVAVFSGTDSQMEFVSYLLASVVALEELAIKVARYSHDGGLGLMSHLRQLPRASPNAQIYMS